MQFFFLIIGDIWYIWFINVVLDFRNTHQKYPFWEWGKGDFSLGLSGLVYHNPRTDLNTVGWGKRYHYQQNNQVLPTSFGSALLDVNGRAILCNLARSTLITCVFFLVVWHSAIYVITSLSFFAATTQLYGSIAAMRLKVFKIRDAARN